MENKIFCIGLNKTGTSSLHAAFEILGLKSVHFRDDEKRNIKDIIENNYFNEINIIEGLTHYNAFSDWDRYPTTIPIFKEFDKQYPNSKFILNIRDLEPWLKSRVKHVERNQQVMRENPSRNLTWLTIDIEGWTKEYNLHYNAAFEYFKDRPNDILTFDVTKGDGWDKLCPFLDLEKPNIPFPKKNVATN